MVKLKVAKRRVENPDKICSICGYNVEKYTLYQNAFLCDNCIPILKPEKKDSKKKIPNEKNMIKKLMEYNKND